MIARVSTSNLFEIVSPASITMTKIAEHCITDRGQIWVCCGHLVTCDFSLSKFLDVELYLTIHQDVNVLGRIQHQMVDNDEPHHARLDILRRQETQWDDLILYVWRWPVRYTVENAIHNVLFPTLTYLQLPKNLLLDQTCTYKCDMPQKARLLRKLHSTV